jgi:hypothetical protein
MKTDGSGGGDKTIRGSTLEPRRGPKPRGAEPSERVNLMGLELMAAVARVERVQVILRKLGRGSRAVSGRLVRAPRKGSVIVIEFADGMHEYVTTAVKRVLRLAHQDVYYVETVNSRYRLEVQERDRVLEDASSG